MESKHAARAQDIHKIYTRHIQDIYRIYTQNIYRIYTQNIYRIYTQNIHRIYTRYIQDIHKIYIGYIQDIYRIYTRYINRIYTRYVQDIYKTSNYQKKSDGPLPVKWLAIECIRDRVFSTQSDVWAFGIVLWEFFSLGKTPYPGLEAGDRFFDMLMNDYRMPQPLFAPREVYRIMSECWAREPTHRPRFRELADMLGDLLEAGEVDRYMDLGRRYESSDRRTGDILQWMASPDYQVDSDSLNGRLAGLNGFCFRQ